MEEGRDLARILIEISGEGLLETSAQYCRQNPEGNATARLLLFHDICLVNTPRLQHHLSGVRLSEVNKEHGLCVGEEARMAQTHSEQSFIWRQTVQGTHLAVIWGHFNYAPPPQQSTRPLFTGRMLMVLTKYQPPRVRK